MGYLRDHWNGQHSLPRSFWINTILFSVPSRLASHLVERDTFRLQSEVIVVVSSVLLVLEITLFTWQMTGLWRSAAKRWRFFRQHGQWDVWGSVARGLVVLWVSVALHAIGGNTSRFYDLMFSTAAIQAIPGHVIEVRNHGTEIHVLGGLDSGTARDLEQIAKSVPSARFVVLDNSGGLVSEGEAIAGVVRRLKLGTYTGRECTSACSAAFIGGYPRLLGQNATLGFHAYSLGDGTTTRDDPTMLRMGVEHFVSYGITREFAEVALRTPPTDIWYPTPGVLLDANVVNRIVDGQQFAATSGMTASDLAEARAAWGEIPTIAALSRSDPAIHALIMDIFNQSLAAGYSVEEIQGLIQPHIAQAIRKSIPRANDVSLVKFTKLMAAILKHLADASPVTCHPFVVSGSSTYSSVLTADLISQDVQIAVDLIDSAATSPNDTVDSQAEIDEILQGINLKLARRNDIDISLMSAQDAEITDPRLYCLTAAALYDEIAKLPAAQVGRMVRTFYQLPPS